MISNLKDYICLGLGSKPSSRIFELEVRHIARIIIGTRLGNQLFL